MKDFTMLKGSLTVKNVIILVRLVMEMQINVLVVNFLNQKMRKVEIHLNVVAVKGFIQIQNYKCVKVN